MSTLLNLNGWVGGSWDTGVAGMVVADVANLAEQRGEAGGRRYGVRANLRPIVLEESRLSPLNQSCGANRPVKTYLI